MAGSGTSDSTTAQNGTTGRRSGSNVQPNNSTVGSSPNAMQNPGSNSGAGRAGNNSGSQSAMRNPGSSSGVGGAGC
jgi:hypothetical protein